MSRKSLQTKTMSDQDLIDAIVKYRDHKDVESHLKKQIKSLGDDIKQEIQNRDITEFIADGIRATITITANQDVNELQAIEILRKELSPEQFNKVVKTREYIDDDEFERLVYAHEVDAEILMPAITPKAPTVTLRLGKVKSR